MNNKPRSPHFPVALGVLMLVPLLGCANSAHSDASDQVRRQPSSSHVTDPVDTAGLSALVAGIQAAIEESRRRLNVPGAAVAIVLADRPILLSGFGERNMSGEPVTPSTLFSIGSCTKSFTALAAAISAEDHRRLCDRLPVDIFPGRREVPKTLIFAKDDSHAEDIVEIVRDEFGRGNAFCQKITYKVTAAQRADFCGLERIERLEFGRAGGIGRLHEVLFGRASNAEFRERWRSADGCFGT